MIAENLYDEMGCGDLSNSHLEILKRFSRSIGYSESDIDSIRPLPATLELNARMIKVATTEFFLGIGAVGLGAEFAGAEFFQNVYAAFRKKPFLTPADLHVYEIHAGDDTRHRRRTNASTGVGHLVFRAEPYRIGTGAAHHRYDQRLTRTIPWR